MSEKKVVRRSTAIVLGVLCIVLLIGMVGAVIYYNNVVNDKNATYNSYASSHSNDNSAYNSLQTDYNNYKASHSHSDPDYDSLNSNYNDYQSTHSHTNSQYNSAMGSLQSSYSSLVSTYSNYQSTHSHTNDEYDSLVTQIANLQAPSLVKVSLTGSDNRPFLGTPYLYVSGYVCNVGTNPAYNSRVHVVAYQSGGVIAIDTYISLGTIFGARALPGSSWTSVGTSVYYSGSALTSWTLTLEWTP